MAFHAFGAAAGPGPANGAAPATHIAFDQHAPTYGRGHFNARLRGRILKQQRRVPLRASTAHNNMSRRASRSRSHMSGGGGTYAPKRKKKKQQQHKHVTRPKSHKSGCECEYCICTICTCGIHRCPDSPKRTHYDPNLKSHYAEFYTGKQTAPAASARPKLDADRGYTWHDDERPFRGETTYNLLFTDHGTGHVRQSGISPELRSTISTISGHGVPMESVTSHNHYYQRWHIKPAESCRPKTVDPTVGEAGEARVRDGRSFQTEARSQFKDRVSQVERQDSFRPAYLTKAHVVPSAKFQALTTNKDFYRGWGGARPARSSKSFQVLQRYPDHRDFSTEHLDLFTPKSISQCPAKAVAVTTKYHRGHVCVEPCGDNTWQHVQAEGRERIW